MIGLVVAVLVVVGVLAVVRSGDDATPPADQSVLGPVLLVPGYGGSTASLQPLADALRAAGRDATVVDVPDGGTGDLRDQAAALGTAVEAARAGAGGALVDVVGYSAGGVVARYWAARLDGAAEARRILTLGSPHHGTDLAALGVSLGSGACPVACTQLAPGSTLLDDLNRGDETPSGPVWVSIWTDDDRTVNPPTSASLDGAFDLPVQSVCPDPAGQTLDHGDLPRSPVVQAIVVLELGTAAPATPPASVCTA